MSEVLLPFLRGLPAMATSFTPLHSLSFDLRGVYTGVRRAGLVLERRSGRPVEAEPGARRGRAQTPMTSKSSAAATPASLVSWVANASEGSR